MNGGIADIKRLDEFSKRFTGGTEYSNQLTTEGTATGNDKCYDTLYENPIMNYLELFTVRQLELPKNTIEGSIIKDFKKVADNGISRGQGYKTFVVLGTRFSGKTTLMKQMYNYLSTESMFIYLRSKSKILTVKNLLKFIESKMCDNTKYIFIDEVTLLKDLWLIKDLYDWSAIKGVNMFIAGTESMLLAEVADREFAGRAVYVNALYDKLYVDYVLYNYNRDNSFRDFINYIFTKRNFGNVIVSSESKIDLMLKGQLDLIQDSKDEDILKFYAGWRRMHIERKDLYVKTELLLLIIRYVTLRSTDKTLSDQISNYLNNKYGSIQWLPDSFGHTNSITSVRQMREYITEYLKKIGVFRSLSSNSLNRTLTCTCGDLISESLVALGYVGEEQEVVLTRDLSLSLGAYTESVFYNIMCSVLGISSFIPDIPTRIEITRKYYSIGDKDYEIDFIVSDYRTHKRLLIDTKGNKHRLTPSMLNIQDYDRDKDIVVILANEYKQHADDSHTEDINEEERFIIEYLTYEDFLFDFLPKWKNSIQ